MHKNILKYYICTLGLPYMYSITETKTKPTLHLKGHFK